MSAEIIQLPIAHWASFLELLVDALERDGACCVSGLVLESLPKLKSYDEVNKLLKSMLKKRGVEGKIEWKGLEDQDGIMIKVSPS